MSLHADSALCTLAHCADSELGLTAHGAVGDEDDDHDGMRRYSSSLGAYSVVVLDFGLSLGSSSATNTSGNLGVLGCDPDMDSDENCVDPVSIFGVVGGQSMMGQQQSACAPHDREESIKKHIEFHNQAEEEEEERVVVLATEDDDMMIGDNSNDTGSAMTDAMEASDAPMMAMEGVESVGVSALKGTNEAETSDSGMLAVETTTMGIELEGVESAMEPAAMGMEMEGVESVEVEGDVAVLKGAADVLPAGDGMRRFSLLRRRVPLSLLESMEMISKTY